MPVHFCLKKKKITFFILEVVKTTFTYILLHCLFLFPEKKILSTLKAIGLQHYLHNCLAGKDEKVEVKQMDTAGLTSSEKKNNEGKQLQHILFPTK